MGWDLASALEVRFLVPVHIVLSIAGAGARPEKAEITTRVEDDYFKGLVLQTSTYFIKSILRLQLVGVFYAATRDSTQIPSRVFNCNPSV